MINKFQKDFLDSVKSTSGVPGLIRERDKVALFIQRSEDLAAYQDLKSRKEYLKAIEEMIKQSGG